jgi:hypothetical protein
VARVKANLSVYQNQKPQALEAVVVRKLLLMQLNVKRQMIQMQIVKVKQKT